MKNIGISAVVAVALSSSLVMADDALAESFKSGSTHGKLGVFGFHKEKKEGSSDEKKSGSAHAFMGVDYQSAPLHGVSVGFSGWGNTRLSDTKGEYKKTIKTDAIVSRAFLKVAHEGMGSVTLGRQKISGLEWLTQYIEGAIVELKPMEELSVTAAWAKSRAKVKVDDVTNGFKATNEDDKGLYALDVKYSLMDMLVLNPYYYHKADQFSAPGVKATLEVGLGGDMKSTTMAQYVAVMSEGKAKDAKKDDGSVMQIEQGFEFSGAGLAVGYIMTDEKGGKNELGNGDQSPFEEGNNVYEVDAKTLYVMLGYEYEGLSFGALYGTTEYGAGKTKESEIDVSVGYEFIKNLETSIVYADVTNDDKAESYSVVKALASYSF